MAERSPETDADPLQPRLDLQSSTDVTCENQTETTIFSQQPESTNLHATQQPVSTIFAMTQQQPNTASYHSEVDTRKDLPTAQLPPYFHFNRLLLEISKHISGDTLEEIKFLYKDEIKSRLNEKIHNARDLFKTLEQRRYITPDNMINLQSIVMMIEDAATQKQLMCRIFQHSVEHKAIYFRRSTDEPPNGYRQYQCHIKGVEHCKFDIDKVRSLQYTVASITGIEPGQILIDGIQMTNSIYITFLMKDVHYRMFYELLREGIPLLSDMNVDMVTFYSVEENKKETVINVLSGRKIYLDLPPVRESQEERIQRLHSIIEDIQLQNIEYRSRIEELSLKMSTKVEIDSIPLSEDVNRAIQDALKEGVSKPTIHRVIELNTKLVETLEEKKSFASEKKLKTALKCAEVEIEALKAKYGVLQEEHTTDKDNIHESTTERDIQAGSDELGNNQRTTDGEATTDIMIDKKEQALLDDLNDSLKRADSLGYSKSVIDQVVVRNGLYVEHKCRKTFQLEIKWLHLDNRLLQDKLIATNSLLQQTANSFGFKQGLMSQIETVFESEGSDIPANKGFMTDVIQLVMELGTMITYDEELKLNSGIKDVPLTVKVKRDRRFLLLRLYYLENLKSDLLILIEAFVSQKLREIKRDDLEERWSQRVMPRDPALKLQELLQKMSLENIPGLPDLFIEINSRLRDRDKALLRKKLPKDDKCQDQDLLQRIMKLNNGDFQKRPDDIPPLVQAILEDINRKDLSIEFEVKFKRLMKALKPELREILRSTCSKMSKNKKKDLRRRLKEDAFVEDDDILECLILEHFEKQQGNFLVDDVDAFVKQTLREINKETLYDDFEKLLEKKGLKGSIHTNLRFRIDSAGSDTNKLILDKITELGEEIKSLKLNQKGPHVSADILNPGLAPWSEGLANERRYRQFFKESVSASGFDFGKQPFQFF